MVCDYVVQTMLQTPRLGSLPNFTRLDRADSTCARFFPLLFLADTRSAFEAFKTGVVRCHVFFADTDVKQH